MEPPLLPIQADIYIPPLLRTATGSSHPNKQHWSPISCTLIHTPTEALLIDTSPTLDQTSALADWIAETLLPGCELKYFFTTHAHGDHFLGFPALLARWPDIQPIATAAVANAIEATYTREVLAYWRNLWPDHPMSTDTVTFHPLPATNTLTLSGHTLHAYDVVQGDSEANAYLHIPSLSLIVAGDLVYGACHVYLAEANTRQKRDDWINAIEQIEALGPKVVVPGHRRRTEVDGAWLLRGTKEYMRVFERELAVAGSAGELEERMGGLFPGRWGGYILQRSCEESWANREV
ncbi:uncharacterized protein LTR77_008273 [Saxophila tyrrhenica]|uniref:Metallo-beta-lactamase domain-containing protein n=1 Tax=Saxophila tyrrhenica TaxID=1690608 RepID=A0AAV9P2Z7_9PEZI|nr:hypothetical protein LTR77_008273 [Saxophila tyrrhenica]